MSRTRRGNTLLELLVAFGLSTLVLGAAWSSWWVLNRASRTQNARIDARHQLLSGMDRARMEIQACSYIFTDTSASPSNTTIDFGGYTYNIPPINAPLQAGDLVVAEPETANETSTTWKVYALSFEARVPADPNNPNALQIVQREATGITPATPTDPSTIDFAGINPDLIGTVRLQAYIDPSAYQLQITGSNAGSTSPKWVMLKFTFKLTPTDVTSASKNYLLSEPYQVVIFPRNQMNR